MSAPLWTLPEWGEIEVSNEEDAAWHDRERLDDYTPAPRLISRATPTDGRPTVTTRAPSLSPRAGVAVPSSTSPEDA